MYSNKIIRKFIELKAKNIPQDKIAVELKVSERTLTNWNRKYLDEILLQKQIELDEIKNSLNIANDQQLEFYSKIIEKSKAAFLNSNFENLESSDLFKIFNLAVNQVQKCRYINPDSIKFSEKYAEEEEPKPLFYSPLCLKKK